MPVFDFFFLSLIALLILDIDKVFDIVFYLCFWRSAWQNFRAGEEQESLGIIINRLACERKLVTNSIRQ